MVNIGDEVRVVVTEIDSLGRINLSRKAAMSDEERASEVRAAGVPDGGNGHYERRDRADGRGGRRRDGFDRPRGDRRPPRG